MSCLHMICEEIGLTGRNGDSICLGELHGLLYVGNPSNSQFDLGANYTLFSEHYIRFSDEELEELDKLLAEGRTDDARNRFDEILTDTILEKLL